VNGTVGFYGTTMSVNPGLAGVFPWLSVQAGQWQFYRFHRLSFRYLPRCSATASGSVILSPEYNRMDAPPSSETMAANTADAVEGVCWQELVLHANVQSMFSLGPRKLVRAGAVMGDLQLFDAMAFTVATIGMADTTGVGKLWVDYDVEFYSPQTSTEDSTVRYPVNLLVAKATSQAVTTGVSTPVAWTSVVANGFLNSVVTVTGADVLLSQGMYEVYFQCTITGITGESGTFISAHCELLLNDAQLNPPSRATFYVDNAAGGWNVPLAIRGLVSGLGELNAMVKVDGTGTLLVSEPQIWVRLLAV
jgi:hypothetical protein